MRTEAFAQAYEPSLVDRFGVWLSGRSIRKCVPSFKGKRVGDFGCGYHASFFRTVIDEIQSGVLADVQLAPDLKDHRKVTSIEGDLGRKLSELPDASLDVIMCISVLEHLWEPLPALRNLYRLLDKDGVCLLNVPTWRGKKCLELSAFRLGWSPKAEMDDHKIYYDLPQFWPLLVQAGFRPSGIRMFWACPKVS